MGDCLSVEDDGRQNANNVHRTKNGTDAPKRPRKSPPKSDRVQSIVRVGSKVFKPVSVPAEDDKNRQTTKLSAEKASNYDHVHNVVDLTFEANGSSHNDSRGQKRTAGVVGLRNMGNTCFLNSSLQCLSNTIPLTDYFLGYDYRKEINHANFLGTGGKLVRSFGDFTKQVWLGKKNVLEPSSFKAKLEKFAPQFEGASQHDAQELLAYLLDGIHEDLNRVKERPYIEEKDCDGTNDEGDAIQAWQRYLMRNKSIIVDLFQGQLRNTLQCKKCGFKNIKFEPFMYLSLPISDGCSTLDDCLSLFCTTESLTGDDQWYCPKCKAHVDATKKFDLWMLPPILIIHLKRFKYSESGVRSKIKKRVDFPLQDWDLSGAKKSKGGMKPLYNLYAVSNHYGDLGSGHYTAHAMNRFDDDWYEFNDSRYTRAKANDIGQSSSAYMLFYNRIEGEARRASGNARNPVILRQSVNRPELWPHMQVEEDHFRDFARSTIKPRPPDKTGTEFVTPSLGAIAED